MKDYQTNNTYVQLYSMISINHWVSLTYFTDNWTIIMSDSSNQFINKT